MGVGMHWRSREAAQRREDALVTAIGIAAMLSVIAGIGAWLWEGDSRFLLLCLPILLFK